MLAESYFDETNTHRSPSDRLCVGGYIFLKEAAEEQAKLWHAMLEKWGLPYFHMVDCAHNAEVFGHLTKDDCDQAARQAIGIIKSTASAGLYITVLESDYDEIIPSMKFMGSAYDACARDVMAGVSAWIENNNFTGDMHYFFEAGAETENNASHCILEMMQEPDIRREARYSGHSFVPKAKSPGVQAADLLAWHAGQDCKRTLRGDPMRKDFKSLREFPHVGIHLTREALHERARIIYSEIEETGLTRETLEKLEAYARRSPKPARKPRG